MRRDFLARAASLRLTPALARLLYYVEREPGQHQTVLAARLEVTPATLGRMVDRLVERGYLRRVADADDRRAFRVFLDRAAGPTAEQIVRLGRETETRALTGLSATERAQLRALLGRVHDNLTNGDSSR